MSNALTKEEVLEKLLKTDKIYKDGVAAEVRRENFTHSGFIYSIQLRSIAADYQAPSLKVLWGSAEVETANYALSIEKALELIQILVKEPKSESSENKTVGFVIIAEAIEGLVTNYDWTLSSNSWPMPLGYFDEKGEFLGTRLKN